MVCMEQTKKDSTKTLTQDEESKQTVGALAMDIDVEIDPYKMELQRLTGGNLITHPPLFDPNGECLLLMSDDVIQVYFAATGLLSHKLVGAKAKLIDMQFELTQAKELVACTAGGEVLRWKWRTGELVRKQQLQLPAGNVLTFNLLNYYANAETACAFVTVRCVGGIHWFVVNTSNGEQVKVACSLKLRSPTPLVAVDTGQFKYIVLTQGFYVYFICYTSWNWIRLKNAHKVPITVVRVHPSENAVATGDETGKIFLWREYWDKSTVKTSLYHWHHTSVTSIAFSASGSSFYSSGLEATLVKWNIAHPNMLDFIPRMSSVIRHIAVNNDNSQVAVCTADNGVQFVGTDNQLQSTLQEFTYIADDRTGRGKFPVGLRKNPRANTLVLNGRVGHLQFYSVHTKSFLYNMDIVNQNELSLETDKILYNINVTKAAFNIDWMATGEVFNDEEHLPELRLKFWKYQEETQSYVLNTNIELPHQGGFKAIEFSSENAVDQLLCATVGEENTIKVWSLEESDNIYKKGKVWYCIAETSYKNLPVEDISFSQDGSLLAAGFGHTLCIYIAETLTRKAALTTTAGYDEAALLAKIQLMNESVNGAKNELNEHRKKVINMFLKLLETNDEALIKELKKTMEKNSKNLCEETPKDGVSIEDKQKAQLYNIIINTPELSFFQKILLFQKVGIQCKVRDNYKAKVAAYLGGLVKKLKQQPGELNAKLHRLNMGARFKAKHRLAQYERTRQVHEEEIAKNLVPIMSVLGLSENAQEAASKSSNSRRSTRGKVTQTTAKHSQAVPAPSDQPVTGIKHVQFGSNEDQHLVVVCTDARILVWNVLNLRLKLVHKLSVEHLAFDAQTNQIAAFTKSNELYVFRPCEPHIIYHHTNLPKLYGAIWFPRRHVKRLRKTDWQAQSILYFLTDSQEIKFLSSSKELDEEIPFVSLSNAANADSLHYSTFGTFATQRFVEKQPKTGQHAGPLIYGNSAGSTVKSVIELSSHTMPPLSLLCTEFVQSLVKPAETPTASSDSKEKRKSTTKYHYMNGNSHLSGDSDQDDGDMGDKQTSENDADAALKLRQSILSKHKEMSENQRKATQATLEKNALEKRLEQLAAQPLDIDF